VDSVTIFVETSPISQTAYKTIKEKRGEVK
jgi:hypothetical protein